MVGFRDGSQEGELFARRAPRYRVGGDGLRHRDDAAPAPGYL